MQNEPVHSFLCQLHKDAIKQHVSAMEIMFQIWYPSFQAVKKGPVIPYPFEGLK